MEKTNFTSNLVGKLKPDNRSIHCKRWLCFSVTFNSSLEVVKLGNLSIFYVDLTEPKFKTLVIRDPFNASHLKRSTEFASLFLAFNPRCFRCLETNWIVKHKCLCLQKVSLSPNDRGSLKSLAFECHFLSISRFLFCGKNLATNQSWKERLLVSSFFVMQICHTLLEYPYQMSKIEDR